MNQAFSLLRRATLVATLAVAAALPTFAARPLPYPQGSWAVAEPTISGWSASKLNAADDVARSIGTDAYLVVHHGVVVHSFGDVSKPMNVESVRKSVLSVLCGIEVDRNKIDLNATLATLGIDDRGGLSDEEKKATVRDLLEARSGVYHLAAYETASMKRDRPLRGSHPPGTFWYYNNFDFNTLGTIFQQLTGRSVFAAMDDELAEPLQFQDFELARDTKLVSEHSSVHPAYVMRLSARDLARVGLLMARGGRWEDRQIVSTKWVTESTTSYSDVSQGVGYGYLWWVGIDHWAFRQKFPGPVFSARGNYGQFLLVDPVRDLVIVHRVNVDGLFHGDVSVRQFGDLLKEVLLAAPTDFH